MLRFLTAFYFLLSGFTSFAQNWELAINVIPTASYRFQSLHSQDELANSIANAEQGIYTFDFGLDLQRPITPRFNLGIGLLYSQKGLANVNPGITYGDLALNEVAQVEFVQDYLEITLFLSFNNKDWLNPTLE